MKLNDSKTELPETICPLPWVNLSLDVDGSSRPCCKFAHQKEDSDYQFTNLKNADLNRVWNSPAMNKLRKDFRHGKKPIECMTCWSEETAGVVSYRQSYLEGRTKRAIDYDNFQPETPFTLDLKLSNVCNLKCRICGPVASSLWLKEELNTHQNVNKSFHSYLSNNRKFFVSNKITNRPENLKILKFWLNHIEHIEITGGEPLLSAENRELIDLIRKENDSSRISLLYNTNVTVFDPVLFEKWRQFKNVKICLSIDDVDERFEYQRFPAKWSEVKNNLYSYFAAAKNTNITAYVFCSVSVFNIWYLPEIITRFVSNFPEIEIYLNYVHHDTHFCVQILPEKLKEKIATRLTAEILNANFPEYIKRRTTDLIQFMNENDSNEDLWAEFFKVTEIRDTIRKQSFKDTFAEYFKLITELDLFP